MTPTRRRVPRVPRMRRMRRMRPIDMTWVSVAILIPTLIQLRSPMLTTDLAYQVRVGHWILDTGSIPHHNTYTFAGDEIRWVDQQWGAQVVLAITHRFGSWSAILMLSAVLVGVSSWLLYLACRAAGESCRTAALLTLAGMIVAGPSLAMRPQLLAVPVFACTLWLLASRARHTRRLWAFPVLAVVCAQLHGSFVLLPLLVGLACLEDWRAHSSLTRRMAVLTVLTGAATLINPHGFAAWTNALAFSSNDLIRTYVTEWQPSDLGNIAGALVVLSGSAVALLCARRNTTVAWVSLVRLSFFFLLAMLAVRAGLWWGLVAAVEVAALTAHDRAEVRESEGPREPMAPAMAIMGVLAISVIVSLPWWKESEDRLIDAPTALSDAVASELPAGSRLLVELTWGSWFEYEVPTMPVFVDSLLEVVPEAAWRDYIDVQFARANWREVLSRRRVDAIVAAQNWDVLPYLRSDPDWRVAFENNEGVLFVRTSATSP